MRLTIAKFALCEGAREDQYPDAVSLNGERMVDVKEFLRAADAEPCARGNRVTTLSFRVVRGHDSHRAAMEFACLHEVEIPDSGDIVLELEGDGSTKLELTNGELKNVKCDEVFGCATVHTYNLVCSRLEKTT